jgi:hypothetical protein
MSFFLAHLPQPPTILIIHLVEIVLHFVRLSLFAILMEENMQQVTLKNGAVVALSTVKATMQNLEDLLAKDLATFYEYYQRC